MDVPATWRRTLDDYFLAVLIVCVAVAGTGGYLLASSYALDTTETVEREREVASWTGAGRYEYGATVTEPNPVFETGERLTGRSQYFRRVSPVVDGQFAFVYTASDGSLNVTVRRRTVLASVAEPESGADARRTVWRVVTDETSVERAGVPPGEAVTVPFAVDVNRTRNRTERIRDRLGTSIGETRLAVRTNVTLAGTVEGREVRRSLSYALPIEVSGSTYAINASAAVTREEFERTETVLIERDTGGSGSPLGAALFALGVGGVVALAVGRRRGELIVEEAERDRLDYEAARAEYDEWISTVEVPPSFEDRPRAAADSLDDLVNVAIDVDERVFESRSDETLYVAHDAAVFVYEPPAQPDDQRRRGERSAERPVDAPPGLGAHDVRRGPAEAHVPDPDPSEDGRSDGDAARLGDGRDGESTTSEDDAADDDSTEPPTHGRDADIGTDEDGSALDRPWPSGSGDDGSTNGAEDGTDGELRGPVGRILDEYVGGVGADETADDGDDETDTEDDQREHEDDTGDEGLDWLDAEGPIDDTDDTDDEDEGDEGDEEDNDDAGVPKQ